MTDPHHEEQQILRVHNFQDFIATPFSSAINAICWVREAAADFSEIVMQLPQDEPITEITPEQLLALPLSVKGQAARAIIIADLEALKAAGAMPVLNVIRYYERDDSNPVFPTDVYSFHVDRSPVPTDTILCTYYGAPSELLPNAQARQKVLVPEIRAALQKLYDGPEAGFEDFLAEHFFDLHYEAQPGAKPVSLGVGHLWRLAVDHPGSRVLPCVHRAPEEGGQSRLMLIC